MHQEISEVLVQLLDSGFIKALTVVLTVENVEMLVAVTADLYECATNLDSQVGSASIERADRVHDAEEHDGSRTAETAPTC